MALSKRKNGDMLDTLNSRLSGFFPNLYNGDSDSESDWNLSEWLPKVDIFDNSSDDLVFEVEAPGFDKDDLDIRIENNRLYVHGQRSRETTEQDEDRNYYRTERSFGSFKRAFPLPHDVSIEEVKAEYEDGVLRISMPAPEQSEKTSIEIQ